MQPKIPKETINGLDRINKAIEKAAYSESKKMLPRAVKLLNTFQKKIKTPVQFVTCNGDFWLVDDELESKRYCNLCGVLDEVANPSCPGSFGASSRPNYKRYQEAIMRKFPELVELWWIAFELDSFPCRAGLPELKPTVKPRK